MRSSEFKLNGNAVTEADSYIDEAVYGCAGLESKICPFTEDIARKINFGELLTEDEVKKN